MTGHHKWPPPNAPKRRAAFCHFCGHIDNAHRYGDMCCPRFPDPDTGVQAGWIEGTFFVPESQPHTQDLSQ